MWSRATETVMAPYLWLEHPAARELIEFQDTESAMSIQYQRHLSAILDNNVKVILLASLDDQMVSRSFANM